MTWPSHCSLPWHVSVILTGRHIVSSCNANVQYTCTSVCNNLSYFSFVYTIYNLPKILIWFCLCFSKYGQSMKKGGIQSLQHILQSTVDLPMDMVIFPCLAIVCCPRCCQFCVFAVTYFRSGQALESSGMGLEVCGRG